MAHPDGPRIFFLLATATMALEIPLLPVLLLRTGPINQLALFPLFALYGRVG